MPTAYTTLRTQYHLNPLCAVKYILKRAMRRAWYWVIWR